jgi:hypothetical protein
MIIIYAFLVSMVIPDIGVMAIFEKPEVSPTYIYSTNNTDIYYLLYFEKQEYFAFKVIS